jgi:hypothetical protein
VSSRPWGCIRNYIRREKGYTGALFGRSRLQAGISATRDLGANPLTMLSWLEKGADLDGGAVFPFCWYLALYVSRAS